MAHAAMAQSQLQFLFTGTLPPRDVSPKAEAEVRTALTLEEALPQAHITLATILQHFYWQWDEGEKEFRRAQVLGANGASSMILSMIRSGHAEDGVAQAERVVAQIRNPSTRTPTSGTALRAAGHHDRALQSFVMRSRSSPDDRARTFNSA